MGDLRKKHKKNKSVRNMAVLNSATQLSVLKMNRLVLAIIIGLMALVIYMGIMLFPNNFVRKSAQAHKPVELYDMHMNPVVSAEVDALKSQLVGLVSGSIESKLKLLEESLHKGTITEIGQDTINALQDDLVVLKTYSETGAGRLIVQKYSQQPNKQTIALAEEVSQLRSLLQFLITSCGVMLAAIGGVWVRKKNALTDEINEQKRIL